MTATTTTTTLADKSEVLRAVAESQLESLNETDAYALAWQTVLQERTTGNKFVRWSGRGKGGRGYRKTFQPYDIIVDNVSLAYSGSNMGRFKVLLEDARLKLLSAATPNDHGIVEPNIYCLVGRSGSGKSSLLKRIDDGTIPGFPLHISALYLPQEILVSDDVTPMEYLKARIKESRAKNENAINHSIQALEDAMEDLDLSKPEQEEKMEELNEQIADYEEDLETQRKDQEIMEDRIIEALEFMGITKARDFESPLIQLSPGLCKKVILATALLCPCDLLLLDEPSGHLDMVGLIQLRRLLLEQLPDGERAPTVLLVSHDLDLVNQVANHIIEIRDLKLFHYNGNYDDYITQRKQDMLHQLRHGVAMEKKKKAIKENIQHLKEQNTSKRRGGVKKKQRQIDSQRRKLDWIDQKSTSDPSKSSLPSQQPIQSKRARELLLKEEHKSNDLEPDKEVQFVFRDPTSQWNEPLILAYELGVACRDDVGNNQEDSTSSSTRTGDGLIFKKDGFLFDSLDFCVEEGGRYCIVGSSGSGKTVFLKLLAKLEAPYEGEVKHAINVDIAMIDQSLADEMVVAGMRSGAIDALSFLSSVFKNKSEQAIRSELTNFGLGPSQATTNLRFLSGGERVRLSFAATFLRDPQVLILDNPTLNLDVESVEALIYGLSRWKGTLVFVSHDTRFIRSLDPTCFVLMENEGKLRRVIGGIETYLRSFAS